MSSWRSYETDEFTAASVSETSDWTEGDSVEGHTSEAGGADRRTALTGSGGTGTGTTTTSSRLSDLTGGEDTHRLSVRPHHRLYEHDTTTTTTPSSYLREGDETRSRSASSATSTISDLSSDIQRIRPTPSYQSHQQRAAQQYQQQQQQQQQDAQSRGRSYSRQIASELESINESSAENHSTTSSTASTAQRPPLQRDPNHNDDEEDFEDVPTIPSQSIPKARSWRMAAMRRTQSGKSNESPQSQGGDTSPQTPTPPPHYHHDDDESTVTSFFSLSSFRVSVPSSLSSGSGSYSSSTWTSESSTSESESHVSGPRSHHSEQRRAVQVPYTQEEHEDEDDHEDEHYELASSSVSSAEHLQPSQGTPLPPPPIPRQPSNPDLPPRPQDDRRRTSDPQDETERRKVRAKLFGRSKSRGSSSSSVPPPPRLQPRGGRTTTETSCKSTTPKPQTKKFDSKKSQSSSFTSFTASTSHQSSTFTPMSEQDDDDEQDEEQQIQESLRRLKKPRKDTPATVSSSDDENEDHSRTVKRTNSGRKVKRRSDEEEAKVEIDQEDVDLERGIRHSLSPDNTSAYSSASAKLDPIERERQDRLEIERILREHAAQDANSKRPVSILRNPTQAVLARFSSSSTNKSNSQRSNGHRMQPNFVLSDDKRQRYLKSKAWACCAPVRTKTDTCITLAFAQSLLAFIAVMVYYEVTWEEIKQLLRGQ